MSERLSEERLSEARVLMVYDKLMRELVGEIYALRLERDREVADSRRLDWLEQSSTIGNSAKAILLSRFTCEHPLWGTDPKAITLRAAIDAAMQPVARAQERTK